MFNYESAHGHMPPAVVYGKDGRPLYSWRVLILPYLGQQDLYRQFHLDEPWDSPHNLTLVERMPMLYAPPPRKRSRMPAYHTICHVFLGENAAFEDRKELNSSVDFPDGTSNTILIIEAGTPVPWTKPEEILYDVEAPLPQLDTLFPDIIRLVDGSCSRHHVRKDISEATLRAAITRNGGEKPGRDW